MKKKEKETIIETDKNDPIAEDYIVEDEQPEAAADEQPKDSLADEYLAVAQRLQADFDNFRKRNANVRADAMLDGKLEVIKGVLPIADNLARALAQEEKDGGSGTLFDGLTLIYKQALQLLSDQGVEEIPDLGEQFDPNLHAAVMQVPATGDQKPNEIVEVFQKGYKLKDKVIRYTMVKVAN